MIHTEVILVLLFLLRYYFGKLQVMNQAFQRNECNFVLHGCQIQIIILASFFNCSNYKINLVILCLKCQLLNNNLLFIELLC